ncbi:MAG: hypothetical protein WAM82_18560 [Thermoanaerobaculia bacterium]
MSEAASGTSPRPALADVSGELLPARIELWESSGPVSPRYQYTTRVVVTVEPPTASPSLAIDHTAGGEPASEVHSAEPLARERYERLWADLFAQDVFALGGDLAADKRDRIGVSFNHAEVVLGDPEHAGARMRFDYLLPMLRLPVNQQRRAVVEILKSFVPQAPPRP